MKNRGVTRPMAEDLPETENQIEKLKVHHKNTLWVYWSLIALGIWVITAPFTFGYLNSDLWVNPSGGRGVWWSEDVHTELRAWLMVWSDVLSGLALCFFGWRALTPNRPVSLWVCCGIGVWLSLAPLLFWAPTSTAYFNDTLVGAVVVALTVLVPGMPNMMKYMQMGGDTPPGWSYNPSSWPQRWIMIVTGLLGWIVSRYLATYQLGYSDYVWDPFFGFSESTQRVLDSKMSHSWPISDAGLGAFSYTFEFLMGWMGSTARWRTMPWMVTFFGILVIPLGLTHIFLVISQPVMVGYWCTFCLLAAAIMLPMIPLEVDEVMAMIQHLKQAKRRGDRKGSLWTIFWKGGAGEDSTQDQRSPELIELPRRPKNVFQASIWGFSFPWNLILCTALGIWAMFMPALFNTPKAVSDIFHLGGALVVTVSVISMGEIIRLFRFANLPLALTIGLGVFFVSDSGGLAQGVSLLTGALIFFLSLPKGKVYERYGMWNRYIK